MNATDKYRGGFWPSEDDALLLKAVLLPGQEAIKAWEEWLQIVNIDTVEAGTQRMFPLLYAKLKEYNIDHPLMNRFKGIYRHTWYKNQMTFHHIIPLLKGFEDAGIDALVLKGTALTVLYYKDLGLRPMSDFDLMIAPSDVKKALIILQTLGYVPSQGKWEIFDSELLYIRHSIGFKHVNSKQEFDLHWHMIQENCGLNVDDTLWQHKQPISINNFHTFTLDATDHLMHTCIHGLKSNFLVPIRWVADAKIIIDQEEIEWERLIREIQKRNIVLPILQAFSYLHDEMLVSIPGEVLSELSTLKVDKIEYYGDIINQIHMEENPPFIVSLYWFRYWCLRYSQARYHNNYSCFKPWMVLNFLKAHWNLSSSKQLPEKVLRWGMRKIKRSNTQNIKSNLRK